MCDDNTGGDACDGDSVEVDDVGDVDYDDAYCYLNDDGAENNGGYDVDNHVDYDDGDDEDDTDAAGADDDPG